jgi:hypothetical protein
MKRPDRHASIFRIIVALTGLGLGMSVPLSPRVVYAAVPRVMLFYYNLSLAVLFGAEAASRFQLKLGGVFIAAAGAAAVSLGTLMLLTYLSKPQQQIAVFHVFDENGATQ